MKLRALYQVMQLLRLPVTSPVALTALPLSMEVDGNMVPAYAMVGTMTSMITAGNASGGLNFQSSAGAALTLTALQSLYQKLTNGGAVTVTIDSAFNIVLTMVNPFLGQTFQLQIFSSGAGTVATPTLSDTAVTLSGTTSITAGNRRTYQGQITQISAASGAALTVGTTFVSLAQVGSTNNYTLTLATNTISPTVGQAIFISVSAGTLPSGWYAINKVTSATVMVIAAPATSPAWTATAATLPGTTTVPANTYSPLLTLTAVDSVAAIV